MMKINLPKVLVTISVSAIIFTTTVQGMSLTDSWVKQEKSNWCWAACAENSVLYERKISRHQKDAVCYLKGGILNKYPNIGGDAKDTKDAAEYISNQTENYSYVYSKKDYLFLKRQIYTHNITIAPAGYYNSGQRSGGHATIIVGYNDSGEQITYYDPMDGKCYTCTYNSFCNGSYNGRKYDQTIFNLDRGIC